MSPDEMKESAHTAVVELSKQIYVELLGRAFLRADNAATFKPDPAELAKISIQLAETFQKVQKVVYAAAGPQNVGYDIQMTDMAVWQK
jgi:hypothetical protein